MTDLDEPASAGCLAPPTRQHYRWLREMYVEDRRLDRRPLTDALSAALPDLAEIIAGQPRHLVYTAFDGDLFELAPQMRSYVLRHGHVPANPESIVGYHDAVRCHGDRKDLVLEDDLAILNRCDQLWIFTDVAPNAEAVTRSLAEGVLVELLFFLARREHLGERAEVLFIPTANLLGDTGGATPYRDDYTVTRKSLDTDQDGIERLLDRIDVLGGRPKLRPVVYIAHDPLDAKHVHWLRPFAYGWRVVPLVPTLALELSDAQLAWSAEDAPAETMIARLRLLLLADRLWILPPQQGRRESYTVQLTRHLWHGDPSDRTDKVWSEMEIPKATSAGWHITKREAFAQHA